MTELRSLTAAEIERLWDAFEAVDAAAGPLAFVCGYVPVARHIALKKALVHYRQVRDELDATRSASGEETER